MAADDLSQDTLERLEHAEHLKFEGRHTEAIEILEDLLMEDPECSAVLEEIADNELSLNHEDRAERAAEQAVALDDASYTGFYILGFLRSKGERWEEAVHHLQRANTLRPNNPEILRCLGWALFCGGQRSQGIVTLERSLNLDTGSALTLCDLGVAYLQMHDFAKSASLFRRVLEIEPENRRAHECLKMLERLSTRTQAEIA